MMSVYKYMPTHILNSEKVEISILKSIFEDNVLFFSNTDDVNDPFELKPHIKKFTTDENDMILNIGAELFNSSEEIHKIHYKIAKEQLKDVGILSLTSKKDNFVMWANYANNHKGIVIEFDKKHPFFENKDYLKPYILYPLDNVDYVRDRLSIDSNDYYDQSTFNTKHIDWEYEDEYRISVYTPNTNDGSEIYVKFPKELIKAIYIGCKATQETNQYIRNLKNQEQWKHLDIYNMTIDEKEYKLNPILFENTSK